MELAAAVVLFALVAGASLLAGAKFWVRPKAAIDRVERKEPRRRRSGGARITLKEAISRLGAVMPASEREAGALERELVRAGFRGKMAAPVFRGTKLATTGLLPLVAAVAAAGSGMTADARAFLILGAGLLGFTGPGKYLARRVKRRQKQIRRGLPNALDLLVVCVESGLGLDQAIMQAAREIEHAHPQISEEFAMVNYELRAGKRRAEALRNLAERTGVPDLKKLVTVLIQADRFGTSIAQTLRSHSDFMRTQARQAAEEKAAKLGVKLVFPIFFCILPSLFVVTVGPVMVRIYREVLPMMRDI